MSDVHDKITRSFNMSQIKSKDTKPELLVRKFLFNKGLRYKLNCKKLTGKPDLVFPKYSTVVFINGCFWHGHKNCKYFVVPKTRTEWWLEKINSNIVRDINTFKELKKEGWKIITVWECQLKNGKAENTLLKLLNKLLQNN